MLNADKPLTLEQAHKLIKDKEFSPSHIRSKLLDMPDYHPKSVYRTALKWLQKDREKGSEPKTQLTPSSHKAF